VLDNVCCYHPLIASVDADSPARSAGECFGFSTTITSASAE
jgi:hypothetical protein